MKTMSISLKSCSLNVTKWERNYPRWYFLPYNKTPSTILPNILSYIDVAVMDVASKYVFMFHYVADIYSPLNALLRAHYHCVIRLNVFGNTDAAYLPPAKSCELKRNRKFKDTQTDSEEQDYELCLFLKCNCAVSEQIRHPGSDATTMNDYVHHLKFGLALFALAFSV